MTKEEMAKLHEMLEMKEKAIAESNKKYDPKVYRRNYIAYKYGKWVAVFEQET